MDAAIEVKGLAKTFPAGVEAVKGIDFDASPGEVFGLLGPNGAGKSTTIGMLTTTILPTRGTAVLAGHDVVREPLSARRVSGVVFQDAVVDRALSGRRNLEIHARLWGVDPASAARQIDEMAPAFGLGALLDRPVGGYSGGERRRLEICRALLSRPRVLFMDEPTVGLDPRIRFELLDLIDGLRSRDGMTILLTTHYLDEAERLCDRVAIVHEGRIAALDSPRALLSALGDEIVEVRLAGDARDALDDFRARGIANGDAFVVGTSVTVPVRGMRAGDVVSAISRTGRRTESVSTRAPTLDDVYLKLTGSRLDEAA